MAISDYLSKMLARLGQSSDDSGADQSPEEQYYNSMSPVDALKFRTELQNKKQYNPEEASANLRQTGMDVAYATPVVGNILSAIDAPGYYSGAYHAAQAGDDQEARKNMLLGHLSTLGVVTGLPFGSMAERAASSGADRLNAILAYHGSPHDFDRFDMSKIGTGEGAQAYGHGLYFAENPETARFYRDSVSDFRNMTVNGKPLDNFDPAVQSIIIGKFQGKVKDDDILSAMRPYQDRLNGALADKELFGSRASKELDGVIAENQRILDQLNDVRKQIDVKKGSIYNVSLDVEPHQLLDWDKPLSEQSPAIQEFARSMGRTEDTATGSDLIRRMHGTVGVYETPRLMREAGIPGIRYADQGSRGTEGGTHNIVMFDDNLIKMLGKE